MHAALTGISVTGGVRDVLRKEKKKEIEGQKEGKHCTRCKVKQRREERFWRVMNKRWRRRRGGEVWLQQMVRLLRCSWGGHRWTGEEKEAGMDRGTWVKRKQHLLLLIPVLISPAGVGRVDGNEYILIPENLCFPSFSLFHSVLMNRKSITVKEKDIYLQVSDCHHFCF